MYHIPSARDLTIENVSRRLYQTHPAYSFNYKSVESMFESKRVEYMQDDLYNGRFTDVKNYDQERELDISSFRTHIPIEHPLQQEMIEPTLREYDPDVQKVLMDMTMDELFDQRMQSLIEYLTSILESEPDNSELVNDFFVNLELTQETNINDQLFNETQNSDVELDSIIESDTIREDLTLDVLIDEILGEPWSPDHPLEDEQPVDPMEIFIPFY